MSHGNKTQGLFIEMHLFFWVSQIIVLLSRFIYNPRTEWVLKQSGFMFKKTLGPVHVDIDLFASVVNHKIYTMHHESLQANVFMGA